MAALSLRSWMEYSNYHCIAVDDNQGNNIAYTNIYCDGKYNIIW